VTSLLRAVIALLMLTGSAYSIAYTPGKAAGSMKYWCDPHKGPSDPTAKDGFYPDGYIDTGHGDCQQMTCFGMQDGCEPNMHFLPDRERLKEDWDSIKSDPKFKCKTAEFPLNEDGTLSRKYSLIDYLCKNGLVSPPNNLWTWPGSGGHLPRNEGEVRARIPELRPGDILEMDYGDHQHSMMVIEIRDGEVYVGGSNPRENDLPLCRIINNVLNGVKNLKMLHIPDKLGDCSSVGSQFNCDSTVKNMGIRHQWICCWHEHLGGDWPLTSKRSAYACLHWSETKGTTWDTLITPRMTFAGCSAVVMRLETYSSLAHGGGKTIEVRLSTDGGATWPRLLGDDLLTEVRLPWAANQRNVKVAWIYHGPVQAGAYWCVDEIKFFTKPSRTHDVSVSEIRWPRGIVTQGQRSAPTVQMWNHGCSGAESVLVRMTIGAGYSDSCWVKLLAHSDTILEFSQWSAHVGNQTVTCHVDAPIDEIRRNDTATLTFRVVTDTWVRMYPIYGGGGMATGACLATVDSNQIFCATGQRNFFAKYLVREDLWKVLATTPRFFTNGGALAYPGSGDFIYACRGNASPDFYKYSISADKWTVVDNPYQYRFGSGAAMAYGGGGAIFALRGRQSKDFCRYLFSSGHWTAKAQVPAKVKQGASLVWTGGDSLYAFCGGDQRYFYRYWISQDRWDSCRSTPQDVDDGGAMAYYPLGNKIYAFFGNSKNYFYAYDPVSKTWSNRQPAPNKVKNGGCLTYCDYSVFGGLGAGKDDDFWRYSPPVGGFLEAGGGETEPLEPVTSQAAVTAGAFGVLLDPGEQLTYDPSDKFSPQYSPDGVWIAYTASDSMSEGIGLYRIPAIGGVPNTLATDSLAYESPRWFEDGSALAAVADDGVYKVSPGMSPVRLAEGVVERPRVTGTWIMYEKWDPTDQTHDVYKVPINGTGAICLTSGPDEYLEPQPISDSDFVCLKLKGEVYQVCRVTAGQEVWLTSDYMQNARLNLSPDRQWLTYEKLDESGHWQVYKMRVDGTEESRVTDGICDCLTPVFSPTGQYIAYTRWPIDSTGLSEFSQVCYMDVNYPGIEVFLHAADAQRENPCWSPDCQYIIYEKLVESSAPILGKKEKYKQIGRARTRIKAFSGVEELNSLPKAFALYQNRPNPFGRTTTIRYALPVPSLTELSIYDVSGRTVTRLVQSEQKPGYYSVVWKGTDMRGRSVPAGTYFYVLKSNGKIAQKRMLLVR